MFLVDVEAALSLQACCRCVELQYETHGFHDVVIGGFTRTSATKVTVWRIVVHAYEHNSAIQLRSWGMQMNHRMDVTRLSMGDQ